MTEERVSSFPTFTGELDERCDDNMVPLTRDLYVQLLYKPHNPSR